MKKKKIIYSFCYLKIRPTRSNIFVTLTDYNNKIIKKSSAGLINFTGKKKKTTYVIESVVKDLIMNLKKENIQIGLLFVQLYGSIRVYSFKRCIQLLNELKIKSLQGIIDVLKFSHNGMRAKKSKRL